jgi:hypothetical protein
MCVQNAELLDINQVVHIVPSWFKWLSRPKLGVYLSPQVARSTASLAVEPVPELSLFLASAWHYTPQRHTHTGYRCVWVSVCLLHPQHFPLFTSANYLYSVIWQESACRCTLQGYRAHCRPSGLTVPNREGGSEINWNWNNVGSVLKATNNDLGWTSKWRVATRHWSRPASKWKRGLGTKEWSRNNKRYYSSFKPE